MNKQQFMIITGSQISAKEFFEKLIQWKPDLVLDVRLKNQSQLNGFTKMSDLSYLVNKICKSDYIHDIYLSPSVKLLNKYIQEGLPWQEYFRDYESEMIDKKVNIYFNEKYGKYNRICLLGAATNKRKSHTEVLLKLLDTKEK